MAAWGKFEKTSGCIHRLEHHCADVAACFEALLRDPVLRERFVKAAGDHEFTDTTAARLTFLAYLHDFGKLNAGFQFKVRRRNELPPRAPRPAGHIAEALLCFDQSDICALLGLHDIVDEWGAGVIPLAHAMLAHHGRPARRPTRSGCGPAELWKPFAGYDPRATARLLRERGRSWFPDAFSRGSCMPDTPALAHLFAGIVALADQLGSDDEAFRYEPDPDPDYIERARRIAADAVRSKGFRRRDSMGVATVTDGRDFRSLFDYPDLRPSQRVVTEAPIDLPLLILESETGSGKTEAAILRFVALWRAGLVDGLYFAVPTRAAAKQLHGRVGRALERLFPPAAHIETLLAVPGYLRAGDAEGRRVERFDVYWEDEPDEETRLARWSAESARKFLSASAAVGTVDQVLLAGLRIKWAHFRAASLSRSLLVVDEVHASDAYMTELLRGVLKGHLALGGHALLMSATLGAAARSKFTHRGARSSPPPARDAEDVPYPALTLVPADGVPQAHAITTNGPTKSVSMSAVSILGDHDSIARTAAAAARDGARVLVIRNTVSSAQAVFGALLEQGGDDVVLTVADGPALHHSRFAAEDRRLLDDAVEEAIDKEASRSADGLVVIGTQTLEQSLDIDADFLISDLCPVDVLLQRIGRLHRHTNASRPRRFREPRCLVLLPEAGLEDGLGGALLRHGLGVSDRGGIYLDLVGLEATRRLISDHATWTIPAMNRMLVERATHLEVLRQLADELGERWQSHASKVFGLHAAGAGVARHHALTRDEPFDEDLAFPDLDEHVRTRLGEDGPRVVLADPVTGPFGAAVQTFNLPAHLFRGRSPGKEEIAAARCVPGPEGGLVLRVGDHRLSYDRLGIRSTRA